MTSATPTSHPSPFATVLIGKLSGNRSKSKAEEILSSLDWAIRCEIPLPDALQTLSLRKAAFNSINVTLIHNPADWDASVNLAVLDLRRGEKLSNALKRLRNFLPEHLIAAVAEAEETGHLTQFIEVASKNLHFAILSANEVKAALVYSTIQLIQIILMFCALNLFIVPKFIRIYAELYNGAELPKITRMVYGVQSVFVEHFFGYALFAVLLTIILIILVKTSPPCKKAMELIVLQTPWIGKIYRDISLMECAEMFACSLATGHDIAKAAEFASKTTSRVWMKNRLERFAADTTNGERWPDAWERMRVGAPYHDWILRNAAAREVPLEGFSSLATLLRERVICETAILIKLVELAALVLNAILVGFIVLGLGIGIFSIIYLLV
ncbi:MAG: hypothetical protein GXP32_04190 [Kiritimatiellaeota bacterium]|nr:hypothetical protein [Kiritimatiellota bacterium]